MNNETIRVKPGEVWQLGRHLICCGSSICGSSIDEQTVRSLLGTTTPGLVWSDPPYGIKCQNKDGRIGGAGSGKVVTLGGRSKVIDQAARPYPVIAGDDTKDTAIQSFKLCQQLFPKSTHIWWGANHYSDSLPSSSCWIVWDKLNGATTFADCELAWTNQKTAVRKFSWRWNGMIRQGLAA